MMPQQYCLRWKHHHTNVQNMFAQLLEKERFCDVTLYCSPSFAAQVPNKDTVEPHTIRGVSLRAHRVVLAACSELFGSLLGAHEALGEPVLVIDGAEPKHLKALLDYMYTGEMNVHHSQLASLLKTAEELRIKGLTDIRWNNKDEPPDCASGAVATTTVPKPANHSPKQADKKLEMSSEAKKQEVKKQLEAKILNKSPERTLTVNDLRVSEPRSLADERVNINGGPPPLIKLPIPKSMNATKRDISDSESPSPKRQRVASGTENTEEETNCDPKISIKNAKSSNERVKEYRERQKMLKAAESTADNQQSDTEQAITIEHSEERNSPKKEADEPISDTHQRERETGQWQHGNMDISASRITAEQGAWGDVSSAGSDDDWGDAPADIGSFLDTRLRVDGDNSADDESNDSGSQPQASRPASVGSSGPRATPPPHKDPLLTVKREFNITPVTPVALIGPTLALKSGPADPRFSDVIRLNDYLQHGRRPQFWEEHYVKRVMEAVRLKELEMKQAAEILGVSYGTLYGRYRDVYGCINRPYRAVRDFWQVKGPSEVLERFQRGEISLDRAASALGVSVANLAAHVADFPSNAAHIEASAEFEPIPIEVDPALRPRAPSAQRKLDKPQLVKIAPKVVKCLNPNGSDDEDGIPASIISTDEPETPPTTAAKTAGKWPSIRVASIDSLRPDPPPASPSQLMRTRPDLTIVAKRTDAPDDT